MRKRKLKRKIKIFLCIISILLVFVLIFAFTDKRLRNILYSFSKSHAEVILSDITDNAVLEVLNEHGITYEDIVELKTDGESKVTSLEIDIVKINTLKSEISSKVSSLLSTVEDYTLKIPIGTIIGNEYTVGRGAKINFPMQVSAVVVTNFKSNFYSAGINQVLHQILIEVEYKGYIVIPWYNSTFTQNTQYIAAQTVIVGTVPEAFTSVLEGGEDGVADDIFDYQAGG